MISLGVSSHITLRRTIDQHPANDDAHQLESTSISIDFGNIGMRWKNESSPEWEVACSPMTWLVLPPSSMTGPSKCD